MKWPSPITTLSDIVTFFIRALFLALYYAQMKQFGKWKLYFWDQYEACATFHMLSASRMQRNLEIPHLLAKVSSSCRKPVRPLIPHSLTFVCWTRARDKGLRLSQACMWLLSGVFVYKLRTTTSVLKLGNQVRSTRWETLRKILHFYKIYNCIDIKLVSNA